MGIEYNACEAMASLLKPQEAFEEEVEDESRLFVMALAEASEMIKSSFEQLTVDDLRDVETKLQAALNILEEQVSQLPPSTALDTRVGSLLAVLHKVFLPLVNSRATEFHPVAVIERTVAMARELGMTIDRIRLRVNKSLALHASQVCGLCCVCTCY